METHFGFNSSNQNTSSEEFHHHSMLHQSILPPSYLPDIYRHSSPTDHNENKICDVMNDCHLTEAWAGRIIRNLCTPITQISNRIPILNPFIPLKFSIDSKKSNNFIVEGEFYLHQNTDLDNLLCSEELLRNYQAKNLSHPQQQLMSNGSSRLAEQDYDASRRQMRLHDKNASESTFFTDHAERIKRSIKFQDRNKKLDFKKNFRNENLKVDGCFHRERSKSPNPSNSVFIAPPPKKQWIRHYMTEEVNTCSVTSSPPLVVSRPLVYFNQQQPVTIDLSKTSTSLLPSTNGTGKGNGASISFNVDESNTSLNLSTESSGYVSNSTSSSLNQSAIHGEDVELEKASLLLDQRLSTPVPPLNTFTALPMPPSSLVSGRRRTISSNSNSSTLRSPSTVRAGTREVHNKLEKNRRAHLKECFESLKKQLPITPDEKKTSNLSILGAAIRHIQSLKRKEREFEHEMERLAKDKICAQNRILFLKREFATYDIDFTKLLPEQTDISAVKAERTESSVESSGKGSFIYKSTSSSSIPATNSPAFSISLANSMNSSPNVISFPSMSCSPPRITMMSATSSQMVPLTPSSKQNNEEIASQVTINSIKLPLNLQVKPGLLPMSSSSSNCIQTQFPLNLKARESSSSCQTIPLNLHAAISSVSSVQPQLENGLKNGLNGYDAKGSKNGLPTPPISVNSSFPTCMTPSKVTPTSSNMKLDANEPPTKLIKLINGSAILAPIDKDSKTLQSGQLTLQQVVGGGGLDVSPIQIMASPQGLRVIGQPNGVTTIELSTPHINGHLPGIQHRSHQLSSHSQPKNLQKLIMNGNSPTSSVSGNISTISIPTISQLGPNGSRLAPGGAELNILPSNTHNGIYKNQGKLAIVKDSNKNSRVHLMQSNPTIVVSQSQSINMIGGKMVQPSGPQYISSSTTKPMVIANHNSNGGTANK